DRFGEQMCVVAHLHALSNLRLRQSPGMNDRVFPLDLLPFKALLAARGVEALAILPGRVKQAARHLDDHVGVSDLEGRRLDGERTAVAFDQLVANAPGAMTDDAFRMPADECQARTDAVGRVVHGWQSGPVVGPA